MKGRGGGGGMHNLMAQANQLQMKIKKLQDELSQKEYESSAGGGAVKVKVKGETEILSLNISEELAKSGDLEMMQDLILTAVNDALKTAKTNHAQEMQKITGSFNIPGFM